MLKIITWVVIPLVLFIASYAITNLKLNKNIVKTKVISVQTQGKLYNCVVEDSKGKSYNIKSTKDETIGNEFILKIGSDGKVITTY